MSRSARLRYLLGLTMVAWFALAAPAAAYVDPGSTSVVFQAIVAVLAAAGLTVKIWWHRFRNLFRRAGDDPSPTEPDAVDTADDTTPAGPAER